MFRARAHYLAARHAARTGSDPRPALEAGLRALDQDRHRGVTDAESGVLTADLHLLAAAWARRQGRDEGPALSRALEGAKAAVAASPYANAYRALASVYLALAEAHPARATPDPVATGLAHAASALRLAPDLAEARAVRGGLLLARARAARGASPGPADARLARTEFERALALDPLLRRDLEGPLRDAEALGASAPPNRTEARLESVVWYQPRAPSIGRVALGGLAGAQEPEPDARRARRHRDFVGVA
jgi:eukaryotic-like serine/threonine-protein kinase